MWQGRVIAGAAGLLFAGAFFPLPASWPGPLASSLALAILFLTVYRRGVRESALRGFLFGLAGYSVLLAWVFHSLHFYGGIPSVLSLAALLVLGAANAAFTAAACGCACIAKSPVLKLLLALPGSLVVADMVRGVFVTSFPWGSYGYSFSGIAFSGLFPLGGVYFAEFAALFCIGSLLCVVAGDSRRLKTVSALLLALTLTGTWLTGSVRWSAPAGTLALRLVQPNLPLANVRSSEPIPLEARIQKALELSSAKGSLRSDLVIWPESVITTSLQRLSPSEQELLNTGLGELPSAAFLFNAFWEPKRLELSNSLFLLSADSRIPPQRYDKRHLVPFGEYVPQGFRWLTDAMRIPMGNLQAGHAEQPPLTVAGTVIAPMICYENLFGDELRSFWESEAQSPALLIVSSNLAWFSNFIRFQHLQFSRARALEFARPLVSVNNNGHSAVVDENGRLQLLVPDNEGAADAKVTTRSGPPTPFSRTGNLPALILALCALALSAGGKRFKTKTG